jgi:hypothetical protein
MATLTIFLSYQKRRSICDAVKVDDNSPVILKRVSRGSNIEELEIAKFLAEEPRKSNPRNHSLPIFQPPDYPSERILVMALCRL